MEFDVYQALASDTAVYPGQGTFMGLAYAALGLNGEAGETAEQIKKTWRDNGVVDDERRAKIIKELGDTLWYAAQIATEINVDLSEVVETNLEKLRDRRARNVISGEGDDR